MAHLTEPDAKNIANACKVIMLGNRIPCINNIELKESQVITAAVDAKIISKYQADSIQAKPRANHELVSAFLQHMDRRPPLDFLKFIDVLKDQNQEGAIDSILEEACKNGRNPQHLNILMCGKDPNSDHIEAMKETLFAAFDLLTEKKKLPPDDMGKLRHLRTPEPGVPKTPFSPYSGFPTPGIKPEQPYGYGTDDHKQKYNIPYQNAQGTHPAYPVNQYIQTQAQLYPGTPAVSMQPQFGNPLPPPAVTPPEFKNISLQSQMWGGQTTPFSPPQSVGGLPQPTLTPAVPYQGHSPSPQKPILASLPMAKIVSPSTVQGSIPNLANYQSQVSSLHEGKLVSSLEAPSSGVNVNLYDQAGSKQINMVPTTGVTQPAGTTLHPSAPTPPHGQVLMNDVQAQAFSTQSSPGGQHLQHASNMTEEGQNGQMPAVTSLSQSAEAAQPVSIPGQVVCSSDLTMAQKLEMQAESGLPEAKFPSSVTDSQTQFSGPAGTLPAADQVMQYMTDSLGQPIATSISTQQMQQPNQPVSVGGPVAVSVATSPVDPSTTVSQTFTKSSQNLPANAEPTEGGKALPAMSHPALFSPPQGQTQGQLQQLSQEPNFSPNMAANVQPMEVENKTIKIELNTQQQQCQNLTSDTEHGSQAAPVTRSNSNLDLPTSQGQGQMNLKMSSTVGNESRYSPYSLGNRGGHRVSALQSPAFLNSTVSEDGSQSAGVQINNSQIPMMQQQHMQNNSMSQNIPTNLPSYPMLSPSSVTSTNFENQQNCSQTTQQPTYNNTDSLPSMSMQSVSPLFRNNLNMILNSAVTNPTMQLLPGIAPAIQSSPAIQPAFQPAPGLQQRHVERLSPDTSGLALSDCFGYNSFEVKTSSAEFYLQQKAEAYPMSKKCRGPVLIINNKHFSGAEKPRSGTDVDCVTLEKLFSNLHFQCITYTDLTAVHILEAVRLLVKTVKDTNAQACGLFILSHGKKNHIVGSDGELVHRADIHKYFTNDNCPNVVKFLFFQACRGDNLDQGVSIRPNIAQSDVEPDFQPMRIPQHTDPAMSDYVIGYPTLGSYRSFRDEEGSWWIQAMVKVFAKFAATNHILELLTKVNNLVSTRPGFTRGPDDRIVQVVQMPESKSTLRKNLYFFPGIVEELK